MQAQPKELMNPNGGSKKAAAVIGCTKNGTAYAMPFFIVDTTRFPGPNSNL